MSGDICRTSGATPGMRLSGIELINTLTSTKASAVVTGLAPQESRSAAIVSGPREFATFTLCPASLNLRVKTEPMEPVPRIPIFMKSTSGRVAKFGSE